MRKINVSDLAGADLDYWAHRALNSSGEIVPYSSDWRCAGPIIESQKISVQDHSLVGSAPWRATKWMGKSGILHYGDTPLVAAMRCFVDSVFGQKVDELK